MSSLIIRFYFDSSGRLDVPPFKVPNIQARILARISDNTPRSSKVSFSTSLSQLIDAIYLNFIFHKKPQQLQLPNIHKPHLQKNSNQKQRASIFQSLKRQYYYIKLDSIMKNTQVQFIQLADKIPYVKITSFKIKQVIYVNDEFEIRLERKCESLPQEKEYKIVRNLADFKWLIEQIKKESPWVIVLPMLTQTNWSISEMISLQDQERVKLRRWYNGLYLSRVIQRFLKMMSQVVIQNIYRMHPFKQSSLFTFLDKSYQLYKSDKYQQSNYKQVEVVAKSPIYSFAKGLGKGSMKILGYLNVMKQEQPRKYLLTQTKNINRVKEHLEWLNQLLDGYQKSLDTMPSNFLGEQEHLRTKQKQIYQLQLKLGDFSKFTIQILEQMSNISKKCESLDKKGDDKCFVKEQIAAYEKFLTEEEKDLDHQCGKIVAQIYEKCLFYEVDIKLKNVYSFKV